MIRIWLVLVPMLELIISQSVALHISLAQHQFGVNGWLIRRGHADSARFVQKLDPPAFALLILAACHMPVVNKGRNGGTSPAGTTHALALRSGS